MLRYVLLSVVLVASLAEARLSPKYADAKTFLSTCLDRSHPAHEPNCDSYQCFVRTHSLDLRQLDRMLCSSSSDCSADGADYGMVCVPYGSGAAFCECPVHSAFNATSCRCQKAAICPREAEARQQRQEREQAMREARETREAAAREREAERRRNQLVST